MNKILTTLSLTLLFVLAPNTQASPYDAANWYFSVDVEQVRNKIVPLIPLNKKTKNQFSMNNHLPIEVKQITGYGHSETEDDLSLLINGHFNGFSINEYINNLMYMVDADEDLSVSLFDSYNHHGVLVEQYQIIGENETKSFYSSKISDDMIVLSLEASEVQNWIDKKYHKNDIINSGMVSLLVNIESAMAHMGADLNSNKKSFNSAVFKKVTQFSASVIEVGGNLAIDAALSTADETTAKQLEQVVNGLIAMNALSNLDQDKPLLSALLSTLKINNHGNDLLISAEFALSLIAEIDID